MTDTLMGVDECNKTTGAMLAACGWAVVAQMATGGATYYGVVVIQGKGAIGGDATVVNGGEEKAHAAFAPGENYVALGAGEGDTADAAASQQQQVVDQQGVADAFAEEQLFRQQHEEEILRQQEQIQAQMQIQQKQQEQEEQQQIQLQQMQQIQQQAAAEQAALSQWSNPIHEEGSPSPDPRPAPQQQQHHQQQQQPPQHRGAMQAASQWSGHTTDQVSTEAIPTTTWSPGVVLRDCL